MKKSLCVTLAGYSVAILFNLCYAGFVIRRTAALKACHPNLIPLAFVLLPENPSLISEPTKASSDTNVCLTYKNFQKTYKPCITGYTMTKKRNG